MLSALHSVLNGLRSRLKPDEYIKSNTNKEINGSDKDIDWGETISTFTDGFYDIQIGHNDQQKVCSIREDLITDDYYFDQCGEDIDNIRYQCENCIGYDLC